MKINAQNGLAFLRGVKTNVMAKFGKSIKEPTKDLKEKKREKILKKIEEKMNKKRKKR